MSKGTLTVISGFSGAGKGTLMKRLLERHGNYVLSISATTRSPREGELDGREYFFKTREEFEEMIARDQLLEYACYVGNYYGTPRSWVEEQMAAGRDVLLEIEIQGARNIKKKYPEALLIFVSPPSAQELLRRLTGRGTETPEVIQSRISRAAEEAQGMDDYDYLLINDDLECCVGQLDQLIQSAHRRMSENLEFAGKITEELQKMKGE
ncbi:MAG TPA: guanylate kinase [Candidatus Egerieimonas intestinavium]|uniref:Guanylate kinase n=1 Tax=Candidatus Egerieimonas intestinavium TaxID=2840777 RepID=A0A9D1EK71_9FIRM|nr:guanylate kinase [Candidatus Egerieimonas intestinavium]